MPSLIPDLLEWKVWKFFAVRFEMVFGQEKCIGDDGGDDGAEDHCSYY